ncbi:MAG: hypothetical protein ACREVA_02365 [Burkholderiales bacterium]
MKKAAPSGLAPPVELIEQSSVNFLRRSQGRACKAPQDMFLTVEQVIGLGVSRATLYRKMAAGEWASREVEPGRNGKPVRMLVLASLPGEMQRRSPRTPPARRRSGSASGKTYRNLRQGARCRLPRICLDCRACSPTA